MIEKIAETLKGGQKKLYTEAWEFEDRVRCEIGISI